MNTRLTAVVLALLTAMQIPEAADPFPLSRDPLKWPFADTSIWNMPIGSNARYVPAGIPQHERFGPEEEIIIMTPSAPRVNIVENTAGWDRSKTRCTSLTGRILETDVPIPFDFSTDPGYYGVTPNQSAAILLADGRTIIQNQPFHRCGPGGPATSQYVFPRVDLYGEAIAGSHGGAGMSAIGGCIRVGELVPGGVIRHALKFIFYAKLAYYYRNDEPDGKPGYRWPAFRADAYANSTTYTGTNPEVQIGSLLCLRPEFPVSHLATEPARIIATALQNYGAYIIDDAAWSWVGLAVEWGPAGRVLSEFRSVWGFDLPTMLNAGTPWANDLTMILNNLHVVANNGPTSKGGGGTPRQPLAPPFVSVVGLDPGTDLLKQHHTSRVTPRTMSWVVTPGGVAMVGYGQRWFTLTGAITNHPVRSVFVSPATAPLHRAVTNRE